MISYKALSQLFRLKPVVAWSVTSVLLGLSVAYLETGTILNIDLMIGAIALILMIQGFLSHAVNDLCDEDVDRKADIKGTGRVKVLIEGTATRTELRFVAAIVVSLTIIYSVFVYTRLGAPILLFAAVGLYAPIAYSTSPLKFGWRPFSEWTVVFPTVVTLIVAIDYIATEHISVIAMAVGFVNAMMSIRWFIYSRIMDIPADGNSGKITTAVYAHRYNALDYMISFYVMLSYVSIMAGIYIFNANGYSVFSLVVPAACMFIYDLFRVITLNDFPITYSDYSVYRLKGMQIAIANAVMWSSFMVFQKVYII